MSNIRKFNELMEAFEKAVSLGKDDDYELEDLFDILRQDVSLVMTGNGSRSNLLDTIPTLAGKIDSEHHHYFKKIGSLLL